VEGLDGEMKYIASLLDQVWGKLGDRFLRLELADHLAPKSTPFRVPSGLPQVEPVGHRSAIHATNGPSALFATLLFG
jgi:hypothetical protein